MKAMTIHRIKLLMLVLSIGLLTVSCSSDDDNQNFSNTFTFDIFTVQPDRETVTMNGEIKSRTLRDFRNMLSGHPNIKLINMGDVPGSSNDEINVQVGRLLNEKQINTHILDNGMIASGGVDFFLAGIQRTRGNNTMIGVHSWSDGQGAEATDFPEDSSEHQRYIQYYQSLGFTEQWSRDFYFFTINAAPAADIHYMTEEEISQYQMLTE